MSLHYGSLFLDRWREVKAQDMLTHWINEIGAYNGQTIGRALKALDSHQLPPSLPEFKALCKAFFEPPAAMRLEHAPATQAEADASMAKVREVVGSLTAEKTDYRKWAREIVELWDEGRYPYIAGYETACRALGVNPRPRPFKPSHKDAQYAN